MISKMASILDAHRRHKAGEYHRRRRARANFTYISNMQTKNALPTSLSMLDFLSRKNKYGF